MINTHNHSPTTFSPLYKNNTLHRTKMESYQSQYEEVINETLSAIKMTSKIDVDTSFTELSVSVDNTCEVMEGVCGQVIFGTCENNRVACKRLHIENEATLLREAAIQTVFHSLFSDSMPCDVPRILGYTFIEGQFHIVMHEIDASQLTDEQRESVLFHRCFFFLIASCWGLEHHDAHVMNVIESKGRHFFIDFGFACLSASLDESSDFGSFKDLLSYLKNGSNSTKLQKIESDAQLFLNGNPNVSDYPQFYQAALITLNVNAPVIAQINTGDGRYFAQSSIVRVKDTNTLTIDGSGDNFPFNGATPRICVYESNHLFYLMVFDWETEDYYEVDRLGAPEFSIENAHILDDLLLSLDGFPIKLQYIALSGCSKAGKTNNGCIVAQSNSNRLIFSFDHQKEELVLTRINAFGKKVLHKMLVIFGETLNKSSDPLFHYLK